MKARMVLVLLALVCGRATGQVSPKVQAQTDKHIAAIQPKVIGKWQTKDKKKYIEFLPDGTCSQGSLWDDGVWHIDKGKLWAYPEGTDFTCTGGALGLMSPNVIVCDYGMGGEVEKYYKLVTKH